MRNHCKRISSFLLGTALICNLITIPASAAGTVNDIHSDTTGRALFSVGEQYSFLITPKNPNAKISYTVGNGEVLQTFTAKRPVKNKNGTKTYTFGFNCVKKGETGIYITENGKTTRIFSAYVGDTVQQIINKMEHSNYTVVLSGEEIQLLLEKGGIQGKQAFERLMKNAKPVPDEATPYTTDD